jgi:hypothetical protein
MKVMELLVKLERMGIWQFIGKITKIWFGPVVFGINFIPTSGMKLLTQLKGSNDFVSSVGSGPSKWHFRDMSSVNSLHIHGNGDWEVHIDSFHPYAQPLFHLLIDYLPGTIQNRLNKIFKR